ncbi:hypothetical protein VPH35_126014 [Triticum aestivum]
MIISATVIIIVVLVIAPLFGPKMTLPLHTKQHDHDTPLHVYTHPAIKLRSCSCLESIDQTPRCGRHVRQTTYGSQPTPHPNPGQWNGGRWQHRSGVELTRQPDDWPAIRQRELA